MTVRRKSPLARGGIISVDRVVAISGVFLALLAVVISYVAIQHADEGGRAQDMRQETAVALSSGQLEALKAIISLQQLGLKSGPPATEIAVRVADIESTRVAAVTAVTEVRPTAASSGLPIGSGPQPSVVPPTVMPQLPAKDCTPGTRLQLAGLSDMFDLDVGQTPNQAPNRPRTVGIIVHASEGGSSTAEVEYKSILAWFLVPASQISDHVVVGPSRACQLVADSNIAWHARYDNNTHLGIEITHPSDSFAFTDFEYRAAATIVRGWCDKYGIPKVHVRSESQPGIIGIDETEEGIRDGRIGPGSTFDWAHFVDLVRG